MPDPPAPGDVPWPSPPRDDRPPYDRTTPMPPSGTGETSIPLSPEPWAEPAIWQPPAAPKRSRKPLVLVAAGAVALALVAFGIVFWPSGSESSSGNGLSSAESSTGGDGGSGGSGGTPATETGAGTQTSAGPESGEEPQADGAAFQEQAGAVDGILADMGSTRSDLGSVVIDEDCGVAGLERVLEARRSQLERARALDVGALENGAPMKDALVRALEASVESNERYVAVAPGCPSPSEVSDVNGRATSAKNEFVDYWAPIAEEAGLPARTADDI
ncbi:hypothetical protein BJF79_27350 [Actinomadura sp. CNU-125]|uniref:hypothetical protein n=1 Tax=Actinomadura sp. CNU-125 TaxID=1904961 RepID=UPI000963E8C7|nr:hypothetical protein [Actinomadura sp. CNU-125]OLT38294.1 hypothetical protein BJF79_27350 [Actinomadura sp. CNU-125]